jgi:hypothetical protein
MEYLFSAVRSILMVTKEDIKTMRMIMMTDRISWMMVLFRE